MKASHIGAIVLALSGLMTFAVNAGDIEAGKAKSAVCAACHGADGNSNNSAWPSLAGQHPEYTVIQLQAFRAGLRANDPNAMMRSLVKRMSDAEMQAVAAYIAGMR